MRKISLTGAAAGLILAFAGCSAETSSASANATAMPEGKALVVYFSATGTTKGVAQRLAGAIGADIFEIVPAKPYTEADLDWRNKQSRSSVEMANRTSRPAIANTVPELANYSTVYIGFPIWWYREPSIIDTFVESNAATLAGKKIVPFATSGGSGMGDSTANLQALAPKAKVTEGRRFSASANANMLKEWAVTIVK